MQLHTIAPAPNAAFRSCLGGVIRASVLFAATSPALADGRVSRAIEAASEMYIAGRNGACPNLRFDMGALIDMLKGYGLQVQVQEIEAGGKYRDKMPASMVMATRRYGSNPSMFCASAAEVYATGSTANVIELQK
jgi:hypothetical protein